MRISDWSSDVCSSDLDSLGTNMLTNATLPSKAFGRGSCSLKWKVAPQDKWTAQWAPAIRCWGEGGRVVKLIGYDCSSADQRRYAHAEGYADPRYDYRDRKSTRLNSSH